MNFLPLSFKMHKSSLAIAAALMMSIATPLIFPQKCQANIVMQNGQNVVFLGDSITAFGWAKPAGYVRLVVAGLASSGVAINPIPEGVGGNTSNDMIARLDADVLSKKPDWVLVSCGVNDAFAVRKVSVEQYESNMTSIVDQCQAAHINVVLLTPTPVAEDWTSDLNVRLGVFHDFLRQLAAQKGCVFCDVNAAMIDAIKNKPKAAYTFTVDNVHMDPAGDFVMASAILRSLGLTGDQIIKAQNQWMDISAGVPVEVTVPMTPRQWFALQDTAAVKNQSVPDYLAEQYKTVVPVVGGGQ